MKFERKHQPMLSRAAFLLRVLRFALLAALLLVFALGLGMMGYRCFAGLDWVDSLLNASMILTGMGPVDPMKSDGAKLFASAYAIFSGIAFPTTIGLLLAPVLHRFLHHLHLEFEDDTIG